jgi:hypothetical protein
LRKKRKILVVKKMTTFSSLKNSGDPSKCGKSMIKAFKYLHQELFNPRVWIIEDLSSALGLAKLIANQKWRILSMDMEAAGFSDIQYRVTKHCQDGGGDVYNLTHVPPGARKFLKPEFLCNSSRQKHHKNIGIFLLLGLPSGLSAIIDLQKMRMKIPEELYTEICKMHCLWFDLKADEKFWNTGLGENGQKFPPKGSDIQNLIEKICNDCPGKPSYKNVLLKYADVEKGRTKFGMEGFTPLRQFKSNWNNWTLTHNHRAFQEKIFYMAMDTTLIHTLMCVIIEKHPCQFLREDRNQTLGLLNVACSRINVYCPKNKKAEFPGKLPTRAEMEIYEILEDKILRGTQSSWQILTKKEVTNDKMASNLYILDMKKYQQTGKYCAREVYLAPDPDHEGEIRPERIHEWTREELGGFMDKEIHLKIGFETGNWEGNPMASWDKPEFFKTPEELSSPPEIIISENEIVMKRKGEVEYVEQGIFEMDTSLIAWAPKYGASTNVTPPKIQANMKPNYRILPKGGGNKRFRIRSPETKTRKKPLLATHPTAIKVAMMEEEAPVKDKGVQFELWKTPAIPKTRTPYLPPGRGDLNTQSPQGHTPTYTSTHNNDGFYSNLHKRGLGICSEPQGTPSLCMGVGRGKQVVRRSGLKPKSKVVRWGRMREPNTPPTSPKNNSGEGNGEEKTGESEGIRQAEGVNTIEKQRWHIIKQQEEIRNLKQKLDITRSLNRLNQHRPVYNASQTFNRANFKLEDIQKSDIKSVFYFWTINDQPVDITDDIPREITRIAGEVWKNVLKILTQKSNQLSLKNFLVILAHFEKTQLKYWFERNKQGNAWKYDDFVKQYCMKVKLAMGKGMVNNREEWTAKIDQMIFFPINTFKVILYGALQYWRAETRKRKLMGGYHVQHMEVAFPNHLTRGTSLDAGIGLVQLYNSVEVEEMRQKDRQDVGMACHRIFERNTERLAEAIKYALNGEFKPMEIGSFGRVDHPGNL